MAPIRAYGPNLRLQEHRTRLDLTQEAVAEELARLAWVHYEMRVGVNADMVGKWERGEKRPSKLYRRVFCLLFQATEEELGLRGSITTGAAGSSVLTDVNRRDFLRHTALAGAGLLTFPSGCVRPAAPKPAIGLLGCWSSPAGSISPRSATWRRSLRPIDGHIGSSPSTPCFLRQRASSRPSPSCCKGNSP